MGCDRDGEGCQLTVLTEFEVWAGQPGQSILVDVTLFLGIISGQTEFLLRMPIACRFEWLRS